MGAVCFPGGLTFEMGLLFKGILRLKMHGLGIKQLKAGNPNRPWAYTWMGSLLSEGYIRLRFWGLLEMLLTKPMVLSFALYIFLK